MRECTLSESLEGLFSEGPALLVKTPGRLTPAVDTLANLPQALLPLWQPESHLILLWEPQANPGQLNQLATNVMTVLEGLHPEMEMRQTPGKILEFYCDRTYVRMMSVVSYCLTQACSGPGRLAYDAVARSYLDIYALWQGMTAALPAYSICSTRDLLVSCTSRREYLLDTPPEDNHKDLFAEAVSEGWTPFLTTPQCTSVNSRVVILEESDHPEKICPICREEISGRECWEILSCGHSAHYFCEERWKISCEEQGTRASCPECRNVH